tara:strand:+ start:139 stop:1494 length:1356 start_codon:yes stop_codon:yes gene_type:complete
MKITKSKTKDMVLTLTVNIVNGDYIDKVSKILRDYKKSVVIPGFRKGKTPMGIIEKKYKKPVLVDEVYKIVQENLYKFISDEKIKTLGSPIQIDEEKIDWDNQVDFQIKYQIGLAPNFDLAISKKDKLDFYLIEVDSNMIKKYTDDIAKRYGKMTNVEKSINGDLVYCKINQLDEKGGFLKNGISNDATISMDHIDAKVKKRFIGVKNGDNLKIDILNAFTNHTDLAAMLKISKNEIGNLKFKMFNFQVSNISRLEPAKLDKELFDKVYASSNIKDIKAFKNKVKTDAEKQFVFESDRMFKNDVVNYLLKKVNLNLPDKFLKKWLIQTSKQPITMDLLNSEYDMYAKGLQWQLIENKILEEFKIQVKEEEVSEYAKKMIISQMQQYGQSKMEESKLNEIAKNILDNEKEKKKMYDQLYDEKTLAIYKKEFNLKEKTISYDDFIKLASKKNK